MADVWGSNDWAVITPADDTAIAIDANALFCGSDGDLIVKKVSGGTDITIPVLAGALLPIKVFSVETGSTTTPIIGIR